MRFSIVFILFSLLGGCSDRTNDDAHKLDFVDPTIMPKTYFATDDSLQILEITWVNDTLIVPELKARKEGKMSTSAAVLINKFPSSDPEIFEDEDNNGYAVTAYTFEEKLQQVYIRIDIALDTSFAVIKAWMPNTDSDPISFNKMMRRVK